MKAEQINMDNYFLKFVLFLIMTSGFSVYSQSALHTPYPIIFVHGISSSDETWNDMYLFLTNKGLHYGGRLDFCLNQDGDVTTSLLQTDYRDYTNTGTSPNISIGDFYVINFDVDTTGTAHGINVESNQSAIVKQGIAIRDAINHVMDITGSDKVILVCHSMGGLAAREYLRYTTNSNVAVAKLVTIGTPHKGANISNLPTTILSWFDVDDESEAIRDLRTSYGYINPINGIYLYGGNENTVPNTFHNKNINCINQDNDNIIGLNNAQMPYIAYTWIVSNLDFTGSDGVVNIENQYLHGFGDIIYTDRRHDQETSDCYSLIRGLDEPEIKDFAYKIDKNSANKGFITFQHDEISSDIDLYKVVLTQAGRLTITIDANDLTGITLFQILDEDLHQIAQETNINNIIEYEAEAGTYYIRIFGTATSESWMNPYTLHSQFETIPPAIVDISSSSLQYYDVLLNTPKDKTVTLTNNGTTDVLIEDISITGANTDQYSIIPMSPFIVSPGLNQNLTVTFNPTSVGLKPATIEITTNSAESPTKTVTLNGNGVDHETKILSSTPSTAYLFDNTKVGLERSKNITIKNTGASSFTISAVTLEGLNINDFSITSSPPLPFDIATGESRLITVKFMPTSIGSKNVVLTIANNSENYSPIHTIELYGNAIENAYSGSNTILTSYEYWYDDQYNNKITTAINSYGDEILNAQFNTSLLNVGLHSLHIRYRDSHGHWSSLLSEYFQKQPVINNVPSKIIENEYWFDDDYVTKVTTPIPPNQTITENTDLNTVSLQNGLHSYHVRYKDDGGHWSSVLSEYFQKQPIINNVPPNIIENEYWFDDNYAAKVTSPIPPNQTITENTDLNTVSLQDGQHSYHVRYKDDKGYWSSVLSEYFERATLSNTENVISLGFLVYPNPTNGRIYINGDLTKLRNVAIYTITGQLIIVIKEGFNEIDISNLASAIYFVKLKTDEGTETIRIVKN